jgi:hypothetical protein
MTAAQSAVHRIAGCVALLALQGCSELPSASLPDPTFRRLVDAAEQFDGQEVEVAGLLLLGPESRQLWITRDAYDHPTDARRQCLTLTNTRSVIKRDSVLAEVTVRGVFKKDIIAGMVDLAACNELGISLLSVRGLP